MLREILHFVQDDKIISYGRVSSMARP